MRIPILMYHNIGHPPKNIKLPSLYVTSNAFENQMKLLSLCGVRGVSMQDAMPYLRGEKSGKIAVLTFDDAYQDMFQSVLSILKTYTFTATTYVVSDSIGKYNMWDSEYLNIKKPIMTLEQLMQWREAGMEIGAHTATHTHLTKCTIEQLIDEIIIGKQTQEKIFGVPITQFSYPYGELDNRAVEVTKKAGYQAAVSTNRGRAVPGDDLFRLKRIPIQHWTLPHLFLMKLFTSYEDRRTNKE